VGEGKESKALFAERGRREKGQEVSSPLERGGGGKSQGILWKMGKVFVRATVNRPRDDQFVQNKEKREGLLYLENEVGRGEKEKTGRAAKKEKHRLGRRFLPFGGGTQKVGSYGGEKRLRRTSQ